MAPTIMNVLQFISSTGFFGAENVVLQLAYELRREEFCNSIVGVFENSQNPHIEVAEECRKKGIETAIFPCRGKFDFRTIMQLRRFVSDKKINIIHSHGYKSNLYSFFGSYGLSTSLVATCHNWLGDDRKMKSYAILDRFFLRQFDRIVAVSEEVRKKIIGSRISPNKVNIVQNGIFLDRFNVTHSVEKIKNDLGITDDLTVIGTVGRISQEKGHRVLLNVSKVILEDYPRTLFLIIGDGPLREDLQREYNFPSIIFTGIRNDVPDLYHCMDIFVLPSLTEGLPMVLLEAMASKLPVVATRVGAVPTVIVNKENGFLVEPGNEEGIKGALLYLLKKPRVAKLMGQKGYQTVKEHFSSDKMVGNYMDIYLELMKMG